MEVLARFMSKVSVDHDSECWFWTGTRVGRGRAYGQIRVGGVALYAHRLSHELFLGPIPQGMHVDHLCRNKICVNPDHLEAVTPKENTRRALPYFNPGQHWLDATHCPRGHERTDETTLAYGRAVRACLLCRQERGRDYYKRKKAA